MNMVRHEETASRLLYCYPIYLNPRNPPTEAHALSYYLVSITKQWKYQ
jgi:hypothetical protein